MFPLTYLICLKRDNKSILINDIISSNEKADALLILKGEFMPEKLSENNILLDRIIRSASQRIDTSLDFFCTHNMLKLDSFFITKIDTVISVPDHAPVVNNLLLVFNDEGKFLEKFYTNERFVQGEKRTVREFFSTLKKGNEDRINKYVDRSSDITLRNKFWSYSRILPYSINIFNTDNFKPVSSLANLVNFIHNFVVWILLLTIITSFLFEIIKSNFQSRS